MAKFLDSAVEQIKKIIKHGKLKLLKKKLKNRILKDNIEIPNNERERILKKARERAHTLLANTKRNISNDARDLLI